MSSYQKEIRLFYSEKSSEERSKRYAFNPNSVHAMLGLASEVGEVISIISKTLAYGKDLDMDKLKEELGDLKHFVSRLIDIYGFDESDIEQSNLDKLRKRFPNGYTNQDAINKTETKTCSGECKNCTCNHDK